jgi:hypothetical protein
MSRRHRRYGFRPPCKAPEGRTLLSLFPSVTDYGGLVGAEAVAVGDFNHDGNLDLVGADDNSVALLTGRGDGTFGPSRLFPIGTSLQSGQNPAAIAVGDLKGDGRPDIVTADQASGTVSVLFNQGGGRFAAVQSYAAGSEPTAVVIGDLNGDGKLDIVTADLGSHKVSVLYGNGDGTFGAPETVPAGLGPVSVVLADLTGDGKLDMVVGDSYSGMISVLMNEGGTFGPPINFAAPFSYDLASQGIAVGDFQRRRQARAVNGCVAYDRHQPEAPARAAASGSLAGASG